MKHRTMRRSRTRFATRKAAKSEYIIQWYNSIPARYLTTINTSISGEFIGVNPSDMVGPHNCGLLVLSPGRKELAAYTIVGKGQTWYIRWLVTLPSHRGRGLAKAMLDRLKRETMKPIKLHVRPDTIAAKIYHDAGFMKTGKIKPMTDDMGQTIHMEELVSRVI